VVVIVFVVVVNRICIVLILCSVSFIVRVVLCAVFCLSVVCYLCVLAYCSITSTRYKIICSLNKIIIIIIIIITFSHAMRRNPLGTAATVWLIVPAPDDGWWWWWWLWSNWWNEDGQGKPKYSEKTYPSATLSTTNPTWPDPGSNPGRRGGKPATNRLSYGAAWATTLLTLALLGLILWDIYTHPSAMETWRVRRLGVWTGI
jgi:hypothetical protein